MSLNPKDYEKHASSGGYMKLKEGENKFRVMSDTITGWEYWTNANKPVRSESYPESFPDIRKNPDGSSNVKAFCAFIVWNYNEKSLQILELTQKKIRETLEAIMKDEDYGELKGYDVTIIREGEGLNTQYQVTPKPPKPVAKEIAEAYANTKIDLKALFKGEDPYETSDSTKIISSDEEVDLESIPF